MQSGYFSFRYVMVFKAVDKSVYIGRAYITAYYLAAIYENICLNLSLIPFVIGNVVGISHHSLALILGKIKSLPLLDLVIAREYLIELGRDSYLLALGLLG